MHEEQAVDSLYRRLCGSDRERRLIARRRRAYLFTRATNDGSDIDPAGVYGMVRGCSLAGVAKVRSTLLHYTVFLTTSPHATKNVPGLSIYYLVVLLVR